jgi:sterol desaturase/sphingolipid hydroxylase (fatty acid hydroxylase superfamily)
MQLSKPSYYADFVIYPVLIVVLPAVTLIKTRGAGTLSFIGLCVIGGFAWTLFEYLLHRYLLHEVPILQEMHEAHHADPTALTGTPSWASTSFVLLGIFLPLYWVFGFEKGSALTTGLMIGYLIYVSVHHATHHWRLTPGSWLYGLKHRHGRHHFSKVPGNFGVTTQFWDIVFGTRLESPRSAPRSS